MRVHGPPTTSVRALAGSRWRRMCGRGRRSIVIGGCARSGTTLLLSILSGHPRIAAIPVETQTLCPTAYWGDFNRLAELQIDRLARHMSTLDIPDDCRYWCEKTPRNVHFFGPILERLGTSARLIHVVRDGRDVVCSRHPDAPTRFWVSPGRWVKDTTAGIAFLRHPQVLTVRYEDLVTCFALTVEEICGFLDLETTPEVLSYPEHATIRTSNAWRGPARPPTPVGVGRWRSASMASRVDQLLASPGASEVLRQFQYL